MKVRLSEVCEINPVTQKPLSDGDEVTFIPMASIDEVEGKIKNPQIKAYAEVKKGFTAFAENDILFAKITPCMENGKCAVVKGTRNGIGFGSTEFHVLRAKEDVLTKWAYYALRQKSTRELAEQNMTGSAGQKRVPRSFFDLLEIQLPDLRSQERVINLLDRADAALQKRREANRLTEQFLQSVFLEMFGDPVRNERGWEVKKIDDLVQPIETENPDRFLDKPYLYVDISSVDNREKRIMDTKEILGGRAPSRARQLIQQRDILISTVRPNLNAVAIVEKSDPNLIASTGFCVLRTNEEFALPHFLFEICKQGFFVDRLSKLAKGASYPAVTEGQILETRIPVPPRSLQQEFDALVEQVERLRAKQRESERELEGLFNSLMQKYFG